MLRFARLRLPVALATFAFVNAHKSVGQDGPNLGELLEIGQELWDEHAPPELRDEYRMPTLEEVETFLADVETAMAEGNPQQLASYADGARVALQALRHFEGGDSLADWLEPRLDFLVAAEEIQEPPPPPAPEQPAKPAQPPAISVEPQYTEPYWRQKLSTRERPKKADRYMPVFKKAFSAKGVPPELAWLSEVESSLDLTARSPVGAYGPFQFMPETAKRFGLRVGLPDDRTHPGKSAEAAATYLSFLHGKFQSWPLAIAAYNAGEGRVDRAIKASGATSYEAVAARLPAQTRMYVPKVLATIALRESIEPHSLPGY